MSINRREFLKLAGSAAGGGLYLWTNPSWALPQNVAPRQVRAQRVTILGAGLASAFEVIDPVMSDMV